jgi:PTS system nitrogen regulatory IIA component
MPRLEFLSPEAVIASMRVNGKKQALQELSAHAAQLLGFDAREIFDPLLQRERLGSTGIGDGVAIPHCRLPRLDRIFGLFARLERPIDFEALDGEPVDSVFLLLAPAGEGADHLKALARVARVLREPEVHDRIRAARDASALHAVLTQTPKTKAA